EAAKIIADEMNIPVVFVTSFADDATIAKAKLVGPYGYIVKPFNELEIKAGIEVALFRKSSEQDLRKATTVPGTEHVSKEGMEAGAEYIDLPEIKTLLLRDIFTDIFLFLY